MTKEEVALEIFLRRMPGERYNDTSKQGFVAAAKAAIEIADMFMGELNGKELHAHLPNEELATDLRQYWESAPGNGRDGLQADRCTCNFIGPDLTWCARHTATQRKKENP